MRQGYLWHYAPVMAIDTLECAIAVAARSFDGRVDRQGEPYIAHAMRVMLAVEGDDARAVAVLHDVLEWSALTLAELRAAGLPDHIVAAVDAMTKRPGDPLKAHIDRICEHELAIVVKRADLADNTLAWRLRQLPARKRAELVAMYRETAALLDARLAAKAKPARRGRTTKSPRVDDALDARSATVVA